jgi:hypothetical protein
LLKIGAEIVPVDAEQADAARRAWLAMAGDVTSPR